MVIFIVKLLILTILLVFSFNNMNVSDIDYEDIYNNINDYNDAKAYCSVIKFKLDNHRVREINISNTKKNLKFIDRLKKEIQKNANVYGRLK